MAAFYKKTPVRKSLFNSEDCKIFKSTYFEEDLCTTASEKLFMKLRKIKIHKDYLKQVKIFVFTLLIVSHEVCIHMQYFFGGLRNKLQTLNL